MRMQEHGVRRPVGSTPNSCNQNGRSTAVAQLSVESQDTASRAPREGRHCSGMELLQSNSGSQLAPLHSRHIIYHLAPLPPPSPHSLSLYSAVRVSMRMSVFQRFSRRIQRLLKRVRRPVSGVRNGFSTTRRLNSALRRPSSLPPAAAAATPAAPPSSHSPSARYTSLHRSWPSSKQGPSVVLALRAGRRRSGSR